MIQKMQMLQKRLISKTEEVVEKELLIQEKEKLYMELKHILARQPGPEVAEQLQTYQATLKEKTRQMKVRQQLAVVVAVNLCYWHGHPQAGERGTCPPPLEMLKKCFYAANVV